MSFSSSSQSSNDESRQQGSLLDQYIASQHATSQQQHHQQQQGTSQRMTAGDGYQPNRPAPASIGYSSDSSNATNNNSQQQHHQPSITGSALLNLESPSTAQVTETNRFLRLCLDLPGVNGRDVEVTVTRGVLMIRGVRKTMSVDRSFVIKKVQFVRRFAIDTDLVDVSRARANLSKGVLVVLAPKKTAPQQVQIHVTEDPAENWNPFSSAAVSSSLAASRALQQEQEQQQGHHHQHPHQRDQEELEQPAQGGDASGAVARHPAPAGDEILPDAALSDRPIAIPTDDSPEERSDERKSESDETRDTSGDSSGDAGNAANPSIKRGKRRLS